MKIENFSKLGKTVTELSRISGLLEKLGNPQNSLKFVHIAGTNGKGSVLELSSQSLINSGYKIGQFTSPFNLKFEDRIRINSQNIEKEVFDKLLEKVNSLNPSEDFSQFELIFAVSLLYFQENGCDLVFLEAGIGGLLDATNIIQNVIISVITSVSFDHMSILGKTIEEISYQKAGIIKENVTVIVSYGNFKETVGIIKKVVEEKNAPFHLLSPEKYRDFWEKATLKMSGSHQKQNATTALEIISILREEGWKIPEKAVIESFSEVQVPSRMEIISKNPLVIIDGAHNLSAMENLVNELKKEHRKFTVIYGVQKDKEYIKMSEKLQEIAENVILVENFSENSVKFCDIKPYFDCPLFTEKSEKSLELAKKLSENILICGSLYLRYAIFG
jgi:dihydrofolate synthase/folylpolyglutamate synthase